MKRIAGLFCLVPLLLVAAPKESASQQLSDYFERTFQHVAFEYIVSLRNVPGMPDHFVAAQQGGRVIAFSRNAAWGIRPVLNISDRLLNIADYAESGLLAVTPHPDFVDNGYLYITYSTSDTDTSFVSVSRFTLNTNSFEAIAGSETEILRLDSPSTYHNGGDLHFGNDGYLYVSFGDGLCCGDPFDHAQDLTNLHGKIIRIDVDHPSNGNAYGIPPDNPFLSVENARPELYAIGFRNPWRFSIDPPTGDLYVGDVGEITWEEINRVLPGENHGWGMMEGPECLRWPPSAPPNPDCNPEDYDPPLWYYGRNAGWSITAGYYYRGTRNSALRDHVIFADWGSQRIWALKMTADYELDEVILLSGPNGRHVSAFATDSNQELYLVDLFHGHIFWLKQRDTAGPDENLHLLLSGPNPSTSTTSVTVRDLDEANVSILIFDTLGRRVRIVFEGVIQSDSQSFDIDLTHLSSGIYIVNLIENGRHLNSIRLVRP